MISFQQNAFAFAEPAVDAMASVVAKQKKSTYLKILLAFDSFAFCKGK
jgi:hypothetical protein